MDYILSLIWNTCFWLEEWPSIGSHPVSLKCARHIGVCKSGISCSHFREVLQLSFRYFLFASFKKFNWRKGYFCLGFQACISDHEIIYQFKTGHHFASPHSSYNSDSRPRALSHRLPNDVTMAVFAVGAQTTEGWDFLYRKYQSSLSSTEKNQIEFALCISQDKEKLQWWVIHSCSCMNKGI